MVVTQGTDPASGAGWATSARVRPSSPLVRVEDASVVASGGPARIVLSNLPRADEIADAVASARGVSHRLEGRLVVTAVPARLVDAAGRVGGAELAALLAGLLDPAVAAWSKAPPDLITNQGPLPTGRRTLVMGVLNVTPDSFSDGGAHFFTSDRAVDAIEAGRAMAAAGADIVDVGGESSRPGAEPVGVDEERRRVVPVVAALADEGVVVSVDTTKAAVARDAVAAGASIVNDISAGCFDADLIPTVAELGAGYVLMHMRGNPTTMQQEARYGDVVGEVFDFLGDRLAACSEAGLDHERIALDPGIGFAKTAAHNLELLRRLREFTSLGRPLLMGASRKSFLGTITGVTDPAERVDGSLAAAVISVTGGARIVRVHDVAETARAVRVADAVASA